MTDSKMIQCPRCLWWSSIYNEGGHQCQFDEGVVRTPNIESELKELGRYRATGLPPEAIASLQKRSNGNRVRSNMSHASTFRRVVGLSEMQYAILSAMESGEIQRRKVSSLNSMHQLTRRGIVEYIEAKTGDYLDDIWRLTPKGRELLDRAGVSH